MAKKKPKRARASTNGSSAENKTVPVKTVPVEYRFPEDQRAIFANSFVVQHDGNEFHLLFFEMDPPLIVDGPDRAKQAAAVKSVVANCVARIVVSADKLPLITQALIENVAKHQRKVGGHISFVDEQGNPVDPSDV